MSFVIIDKDYQKKLNDLYDELKYQKFIDIFEEKDDKLIISTGPVVPGVFTYPSYINLNDKTIVKTPNGTYIYKDILDPAPYLSYPYVYNYKSSLSNYPAIVKTNDNKIIFLPHYTTSSLNQKIRLADHFYDKLNDWIEDDFPNVLKYLKINDNDEVELISSLDDKQEIGDSNTIRRKIRYIKTFIIDEENLCDLIDDFIDEKHIPLFRIYDFNSKFKDYVEEYLIDKLKRKINNH